MKKLILAITLIMMFLSIHATSVPSNKIPDAVKSSFTSAYPNAEVIGWETTDALDYKVEFKSGNDYGAAFYDSEGNFIEDDIEIQWSDVPTEGRMEVYHLGQNRIINILKITNAQHQTYYQVELKKNFRTHEVLLNKEGHIIRKF